MISVIKKAVQTCLDLCEKYNCPLNLMAICATLDKHLSLCGGILSLLLRLVLIQHFEH